MTSPPLTLLRLRGATAVALAGLAAAAAAALVGTGTVDLPFLETSQAAPVPGAYLLGLVPAVAYGAARRVVLEHAHTTAARPLAVARVGAYLSCTAGAVFVALGAPADLQGATARNAVFAVGFVALSATALNQGAAWAPLLVVALLMSIFGALPGGSYEPWPVLFQPGAHVGAALVAGVLWAGGLVVEACDLQTRLAPRLPVPTT